MRKKCGKINSHSLMCIYQKIVIVEINAIILFYFFNLEYLTFCSDTISFYTCYKYDDTTILNIPTIEKYSFTLVGKQFKLIMKVLYYTCRNGKGLANMFKPATFFKCLFQGSDSVVVMCC